MNALLSLVAIAAWLAAVLPPPAPSPGSSPTVPEASPSDSPLKEIGRIKATTPLCRAMLAHASAAADRALDADRRIVLNVLFLQRVDLDSNILKLKAGIADLRRQYVAMRAAAVAGEREMKAMREDLKTVTDPAQKEALSKFVDALAGALSRQQKIADDLGRYIAYLDSKEPIPDDDASQQETGRQSIERAIRTNSKPGPPNPFAGGRGVGGADPNTRTLPGSAATPYPYGPVAEFPETLSHTARTAASQIDQRSQLVGKDEDDAAARIDAAFAKC